VFILLVQGMGTAYLFTKVGPIEYPGNRLSENQYISHNYGEYRSSSYLHDGMDFRILSRPIHSEIYPVAPGTAYVYPDPTKHVAKSLIPATEYDAVKPPAI